MYVKRSTGGGGLDVFYWILSVRSFSNGWNERSTNVLFERQWRVIDFLPQIRKNSLQLQLLTTAWKFEKLDKLKLLK